MNLILLPMPKNPDGRSFPAAYGDFRDISGYDFFFLILDKTFPHL